MFKCQTIQNVKYKMSNPTKHFSLQTKITKDNKRIAVSTKYINTESVFQNNELLHCDFSKCVLLYFCPV